MILASVVKSNGTLFLQVRRCSASFVLSNDFCSIHSIRGHIKPQLFWQETEDLVSVLILQYSELLYLSPRQDVAVLLISTKVKHPLQCVRGKWKFTEDLTWIICPVRRTPLTGRLWPWSKAASSKDRLTDDVLDESSPYFRGGFLTQLPRKILSCGGVKKNNLKVL